MKDIQLKNRYANLGENFGAYVKVESNNWTLIHYNSALANELSLPEMVDEEDDFLQQLTGNKLHESAKPFAQAYAGHQFGSWVSRLGDGRAALLGEWHVPNHLDYSYWDIQLKGSGKTPYSRMGDGRAVLRSTIREYLVSEAMHGLNIPTTRALAIFGSDEVVYREQAENAALLVRAAPSHIRFGTCEYFFSRNMTDELIKLYEFVIQSYYPECEQSDNKYLALFENIVDRTASLVAKWQAYGFVHGVMNTDNMSILGLTIDYGPFGFLDDYHAHKVFNQSDYTSRYRFDNQPNMARWNCFALGNCFTSLVPQDKILSVLDKFIAKYQAYFSELMAKKLGVNQAHINETDLLDKLYDVLNYHHSDYTLFFYKLTQARLQNDYEGFIQCKDLFRDQKYIVDWLDLYKESMLNFGSVIIDMQRNNPKYILRNHMAQVAIEKAEKGDYREIEQLMTVLRTPYDEHEAYDHYAAAPPAWAKGISLSCSA